MAGRFSVIVRPEVANLGPDGTGTRRRRVFVGTDRERVVVFSRQPVELAELPPEVADDPMLVVEELRPERLGSKAKRTPKATAPPAATETTTKSAPPPIPDDLGALTWPALQKLGGAYGLGGKKKEIVAGLEQARAAASANGGPE